MKYKFYSISDKNKEAIDKIEARDYKEALIHFTENKKLSITEFLKLYKVTNQVDEKRRFTFRRNKP